MFQGITLKGKRNINKNEHLLHAYSVPVSVISTSQGLWVTSLENLEGRCLVIWLAECQTQPGQSDSRAYALTTIPAAQQCSPQRGCCRDKIRWRLESVQQTWPGQSFSFESCNYLAGALSPQRALKDMKGCGRVLRCASMVPKHKPCAYVQVTHRKLSSAFQASVFAFLLFSKCSQRSPIHIHG